MFCMWTQGSKGESVFQRIFSRFIRQQTLMLNWFANWKTLCFVLNQWIMFRPKSWLFIIAFCYQEKCKKIPSNASFWAILVHVWRFYMLLKMFAFLVHGILRYLFYFQRSKKLFLKINVCWPKICFSLVLLFRTQKLPTLRIQWDTPIIFFVKNELSKSKH